MTNILTINSGSSSIKSKVFAMPAETLLAEINISDVGLPKGKWEMRVGDKRTHGVKRFALYDDGLEFILETLFAGKRALFAGPQAIHAVAHRVVHGGPKYCDSTLITPTVIRGIKANTKLAPLHTPPNLKSILAAQRGLPKVPHVAVFDTGFHQTIPDYAAAYALPHEFYEKHAIKRYGFHGISYRFVAAAAAKLMKKPITKLKMIACHLGSGCSVCAIDGGKSIDTSMGFTPVEGLMMRTRCGDIDAGVLLHLRSTFGYTAEKLNHLLNHRSGFLGMSGGAATMPELVKRVSAGDKRAKRAFEMFCYRVEKYIGAYTTALGGLDALIFTAGIGENQAPVRAEIVKWCRWLGLKIDDRKNDAARGTASLAANGLGAAIHAKNSRTAIFVIPTDEGLMMARDALALIEK